MSTLDHARKIAQVSAELIRHRRALAPAIAAKAVIARSIWGIDLTRFLMLGLYEQPVARWLETMDYLLDLEPGLRTLNWHGDGKRLTVDKLITAERFIDAGISCARLLAIVGRHEHSHPHGGRSPVLKTEAELVAALGSFPDRLFVKPATGWRGGGVLGPERSADSWRVDDTMLSDRELAARLLASAPPSGLLIQERVRSHRALALIGGDLGLGTVRINTALTNDGVDVLFVFAKIMGSVCLVDNFSGGQFGNMLARVDLHSGRIKCVFGRTRGQRYLMEPVRVHPVTGTPLPGFQLPLWNEAMALARRTAAAFPEAPLIGADVALTDSGPLVIEVQSDWDANVAQLIMNRGLRPVLRELVPRLATRAEAKQLAFEQMGLSGQLRRRRSVPHRAPRA